MTTSTNLDGAAEESPPEQETFKESALECIRNLGIVFFLGLELTGCLFVVQCILYAYGKMSGHELPLYAAHLIVNVEIFEIVMFVLYLGFSHALAMARRAKRDAKNHAGGQRSFAFERRVGRRSSDDFEPTAVHAPEEN